VGKSRWLAVLLVSRMALCLFMTTRRHGVDELLVCWPRLWLLIWSGHGIGLIAGVSFM
jgi:hypothetical protein